MSTQYRCYLTPLYSAYVYAAEVDISDLVRNVAGQITKSIDSVDFSVGVYTFNDVQLTCLSPEGKLADPTVDSRSIFPYSRDRAKVRLVYDRGDGSPVITYRGLLSDAATVVNSDTDELVFTLLGPDSILKSSVISAGSVTTGMNVQQALVAILNTADVRSVLGVSLSNLNPQVNFTIDDGTKFDNLNKRDAIAVLLGASNSVLLIDANLNVIVRDRSPNYGNPIVYLYGKGDKFGRENIKSIPTYNTGLQRVFNSQLVDGGQATASVNAAGGGTTTVTQPKSTGSAANLQSQNLYGLRQGKKQTFDFVTTLATLNQIAAGIVAEFSFPKLELEVVVSTDVAAGADLLDQASVSYPLFVTPAGKFLPVIGQTKIGDADSPLPNVKGAVSIDASLGFKIIEKTEDISTFETTLKLRQVGVSQTDGGLVVPNNNITVTSSMSPYQMSPTYDWYFIDASGGPVTLVAPSPIQQPVKDYTIVRKDSSANAATLQRYQSENLRSQLGNTTTLTLPNQGDTFRMSTDQVDWFVGIRTQAVPAMPQVSTPATPPSGFDLLYFKSDGNLYGKSPAGLEQRIGSAGGGAALVWVPDQAGAAAAELLEFNQKVWAFDQGAGQKIYTSLKVPSSYAAGVQLNLKAAVYSPGTSGNVQWQTVATLIRAGVDAESSTTNQRTSTNAATSTPGSANQRSLVTFDLTDTTGKINGVAVSPGDEIQIMLTRPNGDTDTNTARFVPGDEEVTIP